MKISNRVIFLVFGIQSLFGFNFQIGRQGRRQATFERFNNTCGKRNLSIIFTYQSMKPEGNKLWMNSTITVKEDILKEPKMSIEIKRCENKENLDTCEHFYNYKTDKYCDVAESRTAIWSPIYSSYVPEWKCPLKKGIYRATNSMVDVTAFLMFPFDTWFWRVLICLERCKNKENLDTCEHFYDHKSNKFCRVIEMDSALWSPIFSVNKPPFRCPLEKTDYKGRLMYQLFSCFLLIHGIGA